mmetsp:Transcript_10213/g.19990  ORF Transcript_10213/g.19990 Transcript_10213/m.19990 type:complete len:347 (+) Transcript_10213:158-1198(+)
MEHLRRRHAALQPDGDAQDRQNRLQAGRHVRRLHLLGAGVRDNVPGAGADDDLSVAAVALRACVPDQGVQSHQRRGAAGDRQQAAHGRAPAADGRAVHLGRAERAHVGDPLPHRDARGCQANEAAPLRPHHPLPPPRHRVRRALRPRGPRRRLLREGGDAGTRALQELGQDDGGSPARERAGLLPDRGGAEDGRARRDQEGLQGALQAVPPRQDRGAPGASSTLCGDLRRRAEADGQGERPRGVLSGAGERGVAGHNHALCLLLSPLRPLVRHDNPILHVAAQGPGGGGGGGGGRPRHRGPPEEAPGSHDTTAMGVGALVCAHHWGLAMDGAALGRNRRGNLSAFS